MDSERPSTTGFATQIINTASEKLPTPIADYAMRAPISSALAVVIFAAVFLLSLPLGKKGREAPALPETVPFISNSLNYARDLPAFCRDVGKYLSENKIGIATFRLFFQKMHLVVGAENTNPLFQQRSSGLSDHRFTIMFIEAVADPPREDLDQWRIDTSGRLKTPNPGSEHVTGHNRLMLQWHGLMSNYLARPSLALELSEMYYTRFLPSFEKFRTDEWEEMCVLDWVRKHMTPAAGTAFGGDLFYEMYPEYFDVMRQFELSILKICFGPPRWMNRKPYQVRDKWLKMNEAVVERALENVDWEDAEKHSWIPELGHSVMREVVKWLHQTRKVGLRMMAGFFGTMVLDQNGNTIPAVVWAVMQILTSPARDSLVGRLKEEAEQSRKADGRFDPAKLASMPLFSAVFTETLRLHCSFNITRVATKDIVMEGYNVRKGNLVQAPTLIAHFDPVWAADGYPVDEFWPDRLLKTTADGKREFDMSSNNRSSYWFPFGGGLSMCPGRIFAKQEVCLALAMFFTMLDVEVVGWEMYDGSKSDRPAKDIEGFITMLPDREMRLRVRKK